MKNIIIILFSTLLISSCKKLDVPDPTDGTPVFTAVLELDGSTKTLEAGVDDYYMFTEFELDTNEVYVYAGRLQKENCQDSCGEKLTIKIRDAAQGNSNIEESLIAGNNYFYYSENNNDIIGWTYDTVFNYNVVFNAGASDFVPNPISPIFSWDMGTGVDIIGDSVAVVYPSLDNASPVTLTLKTNTNNGDSCVSKQTQNIRLNSSERCSTAIVLDADSTMALLIAEATGAVPFSYVWSNGTTFQTNVFQGNEHTVTVTDKNGCVSTAFIHGDSSPGAVPTICTARFDYSVTKGIAQIDSLPIFANDPLHLSRVTVEYTDGENITYSSANGDNSNAFFKIISVEEYDKNENGQRVKKLVLAINCTLYNPIYGERKLVAEEVVFGVAYP